MSCSAGQDIPGTPAQCDRVLLAQAEYRGDLHLLFGGGAHSGSGWSWTFYHPLQWVLFTDAGRDGCCTGLTARAASRTPAASR